MGQQRFNALPLVSVENELVHGLLKFAHMEGPPHLTPPKEDNFIGESNLLLYYSLSRLLIECCID